MRLLKTKEQEATKDPQELVKVRPDLNLEKWTIWQPSQSRHKPEAKLIEREVSLPDGSIRKAKVEVGYTHKGVLTTQDQKTFYALIKLWEENGKSITHTSFSLRQLAKTLGMTWGTKNIQVLRNSIERLLITPFLWEYSYYDAETKTLDRTQETPFTILVERKLRTREESGQLTRDEGYFRFHPLIVKNLHANYTKPVLLETVISFKSEIAQIIYTQLDLFLASKSRYERRTKELFEDLGLEGTSYKNASKRKQMLEPALRELQGKPLSSGGIIGKAILEQAKIANDYKVVFEKRSARKALAKKEVPESKPAAEMISQQEQELLTKLCGYGITPNRARTLIMSHRDAVEQQLEYYPYHAFTDTHSNPAGWLIKAIEENYAPPELYQDILAQREQKRKADQQQEADHAKRAAEAKERDALKRAEEHFFALPEQEQERLLTEAKAQLLASPEWANQKPSIRQHIIGAAARSVVVEELARAERAG